MKQFITAAAALVAASTLSGCVGYGGAYLNQYPPSDCYYDNCADNREGLRWYDQRYNGPRYHRNQFFDYRGSRQGFRDQRYNGNRSRSNPAPGDNSYIGNQGYNGDKTRQNPSSSDGRRIDNQDYNGRSRRERSRNRNDNSWFENQGYNGRSRRDRPSRHGSDEIRQCRRC